MEERPQVDVTVTLAAVERSNLQLTEEDLSRLAQIFASVHTSNTSTFFIYADRIGGCSGVCVGVCMCVFHPSTRVSLWLFTIEPWD